MITFALSEEQEMIRDTAGSFARDQLTDKARDADENFECPEAVLEASWELGLVAATIPERVGGAGMERSPTTSALFLEELGSGCPALGAACMSPSLFVNPLIDFGTQAQQDQYLAPFTGASFTAGALALQEDDLGFDASVLKTSAKQVGDAWEVSGEKRLVAMADRAEHLLVVARSSDAPGFAGLDAFIVARDAAGLTISNDRERTIGFQALPQFTVKLDGVKAERLGGADGIDGAKLINTIRIGGAALAVGLSRAVVDYSIPYAKERHAFGKPIAQKQAIAFMLADMHTEVDCMRWMVWKAASLVEQNHADATKATTLMQNYVQRKAMKVADDGIQIFGGHGFIRDYPVEMWFRHARNLTTIEGPVAA